MENSIPAEMRAAVQSAYGLPKDTISVQTVPTPTIKADSDEVLVRVNAAALNPVDYQMARGDLKLVLGRVFPHTVGCDVSGTVVMVGSKCRRIKVGDEVLGNVGPHGSFAEYVAAPENLVVVKPANLSFEVAAALSCVAQTAFGTITKTLGVTSGQKVLILGGSGGLGTVAIQLAKLQGAYVCTTSSNTDLVTSLGADRNIEYKTANWWEVLKGENYDAILDTVGEGWPVAAQVLKPRGGKFCTVVGDRPDLALTWRVLAGSLGSQAYRAAGWLLGALPAYYMFVNKTGNVALMDEVIGLFADGKLRAVLDPRPPYQLETADILSMFEYQMSRRAKGKLVVKVI